MVHPIHVLRPGGSPKHALAYRSILRFQEGGQLASRYRPNPARCRLPYASCRPCAPTAIRDGSSELSSRCDTVQCGPIDDRNLSIRVNHASRQISSCPILTALLIEVAAGTLDCSAVGLSPRPEQV